MSTPLQVALFLASVAIVLLVTCLIPMAFLLRAHLNNLVRMAEQSKADMQTLVQHSHELIRDVTELSKRASRQLDEIDHVLATVHEWTERADIFLNEVGSVVEPPVFSMVKNMNLLRTGVTGFMQALFHSARRGQLSDTP